MIKLSEHGFVSLVLIVLGIVALFFLAGVYIYNKLPTNSTTLLAVPTINFKVYTNSSSDFKFSYPINLVAKVDSEENYATRNNGDARKNFSGYVQYPPAKFLDAVSVLKSDSSFDSSPFTIWVFDNPNNLSEGAFFNKYWYYPFLWGQFNPPEKQPLAPTSEASVSGQSAWYGTVSYQQGSPKYYYLKTSDQKMLLIRVLTSDGVGAQILNTLTLLK